MEDRRAGFAIGESPVAAVMVHVADVDQALAWYRRAFVGAESRQVEAFDFGYLQVGCIRIEPVIADDRVASGRAGSVVYWAVTAFDAALEHFLAQGATLHRGPMAIEDGHAMCQVLDPWGNAIGLRGPRAVPAPP